MSPALKQRSAPASSGRHGGEGLGSTSHESLPSAAAPDNDVVAPLSAAAPAPNRRQRRARSGTAELARLPAAARGVDAEIGPSTLVVTLTVGQLIGLLHEHGGLAQPVEAPAEILSPKEACKELRGISMSSLWRLVRAGYVRPRVIGGRRCYLRSELREYVRNAHAPEVAHG